MEIVYILILFGVGLVVVGSRRSGCGCAPFDLIYRISTSSLYIFKSIQRLWDYEITGLDEIKTFGLLNYDSCLTVNQRNFTPGIYFIERAEEVFAKNIGLVSKYYKVVTINGIDSTDVTGGNELYMTSYLHGIE